MMRSPISATGGASSSSSSNGLICLVKLPLVSYLYSVLKAKQLYGLLLVLAVPIAPAQAQSLETLVTQPLVPEPTPPSSDLKGARSPGSSESSGATERQVPRPTALSDLTVEEGALTAPAGSLQGLEFLGEHRRITRQAAIAQDSSAGLSTSGKSRIDQKAPKSAAPILSEFLAGAEPTPLPAPLTIELSRPTAVPETKPAAANPPTVAELPRDPELGVIQVGQVGRDDELGVLQLRSPLQDPELGILELIQIAPPAPRSPVAYFSSFVAASSSDNIFLFEDPVQGRFGDQLIRPGISLLAFPALGPDTGLLLSARTTLFRYQEQSASNYDEVRFQAGIRQRLSANAYGELSLSHQLLYEAGFTEQFFTNTGIDLTVGRRDRLTPQLTLDSYYQGQLFFSDPERFSNVLNSVGAALSYQINSQWETSLGYRLTISDFTQQSRHETYQRLTGQLRYAITPAVRMSLFGGLSYGRSSESRVTFDDTFFGLSINATVPIF
jgi:hypothetical protein